MSSSVLFTSNVNVFGVVWLTAIKTRQTFFLSSFSINFLLKKYYTFSIRKIFSASPNFIYYPVFTPRKQNYYKFITA